MVPSVTRRAFLRRSMHLGAAAGVAAAAVEILPWFAGEASEARKLAVTCREVMLAHTGEPNCWTAMDLIGVEGVEATVTDTLELAGLRHPQQKYTLASEEGIKTLADDLHAAKKRITALAMNNRFEERPDFEVEWGRKAAVAAQALGVTAIRIDVVPRKMDKHEFLKHATAVLKRLIAATESTGVRFGIENHGNTTNDPKFLGPLFDGVGSARLGLTLDTGNFYWFGHPLSRVYELFELFASRAVHTHCKSIGYPAEERETQRFMGWRYKDYACPITEGDIDFNRVARILKHAGYNNDLCIEDESLGKKSAAQAAAILRQEATLLRSVC